jgi:hypothetical protein
MNLHDALFCVLMATIVSALGIRVFLNARLKLRHPDVWQKLGSPTLTNFPSAHAVRSFRYVLLSSDYRSLNDDVLSRYVIAERALTLAILAVLGIGFTLQFTGHLWL